MQQIAIIQYGAGNLFSVANLIRRLGYAVICTENPDMLRQADKVIFPGVGQAASAMQRLQANGLNTLIPRLEMPVLGICLGMQLLCNRSEEGNVKGLDIFPADMLAHLDVTKTLTPSMEGDAVGGVVNMVMKDAPERTLLSLNLGIGYSQRFLEGSFTGFDWRAIDKTTPFEKHGESSDYHASMGDFTRDNLSLKKRRFVPNFNVGLTYGDRFLRKKLGFIVAATYQQSYRGNNSTFFETAPPRNTPVGMVASMKDRYYDEEQMRTGLLARS